MTPARIAELRRVGVLDGTKADDARIALLDIYEAEREAQRDCAPDDRGMRRAIMLYLDPVMRDTRSGKALHRAHVALLRRWGAELRAQARRRARRRP